MIDPSSHKSLIKTLFVALFFIIMSAMNTVVILYVLQWWGRLALVYLALTQMVNLGIAYELTEWTLAFMLKKQDLPKLLSLKQYPPVAVLYLTCNDFIPTLASRLKGLTYPNLTSFVLDDSTKTEYHYEIDRCGLPVIRRKTRLDFKAGNLNHWLQHHSHQFDYFIVLDNDSLISNNFVEEMVKYAEHEANHDVVIFQSVVGIWNRDNRFARTLDLARSLRMFVSEKIDNPCDSLLPTTNILVRTAAIRTIGGFATRSLTTEDWETGLEVIAHGYRCQRVNVSSYVSMSTNARVHTRRMTRWACGILEIAKAGPKKVPLTTNLRFFMGIYFYMIWPVYVAGLIFVTIWGYHSTWNDLRFVAHLTWNGYLLPGDPLFYSSILTLAYFSFFLLLRPFLAYRVGIPLRTYIGYVLVVSALGLYAFAPLLKSQILVLLGKHPKWKTLNPELSVITARSLLKEMQLPILVLGIIFVGLAQNPLAIVFNFLWLIPLFLSPFVLYYCQRCNPEDYLEGIPYPTNLYSEQHLWSDKFTHGETH